MLCFKLLNKIIFFLNDFEQLKFFVIAIIFEQFISLLMFNRPNLIAFEMSF